VFDINRTRLDIFKIEARLKTMSQFTRQFKHSRAQIAKIADKASQQV
jgi:hypothetical protein